MIQWAGPKSFLYGRQGPDRVYIGQASDSVEVEGAALMSAFEGCGSLRAWTE